MSVKHYPKGIEKSEFDAMLKDNPAGVLVDVYTLWCGPCKMMSPIFEKLSERYPYKFISVDLDQARWMGTEYMISAIPTFLMFKDGKLAYKQVGGMPENMFAELIEKVMK
ncbi:MAG: thioredoxin family protein [Promethearchaeota archaeon]